MRRRPGNLALQRQTDQRDEDNQDGQTILPED
jgi:hypothetical protein